MAETKTAIVTGAKRGIGRAVAVALAQEGFQIALNVRGESSVEEARAVMKECMACGVDADIFTADVSKFDECAEMVKKIVTRFGSVDVLVNNAGITRDGFIARMSESQYDEVIAANQKSVYNMIRQVTPIMMKQRSGSIISMTSVVGVRGNASQFNYAASKAAIIGMTLSAAKELGGRGITVNAVAPGYIETDMTGALPEKVRQAMVGAVSLKRAGTPEDVAGAVAFLASDRARYITGQVLCVDGGIMM